MASQWQGGDDFVLVKRGSSTSRAGGVGDGHVRKRQGLTKRYRFNPNPTRSSMPSCIIHAQSQRDKKNWETAPRIQKVYGHG